jgi:hypothetical protein
MLKWIITGRLFTNSANNYGAILYYKEIKRAIIIQTKNKAKTFGWCKKMWLYGHLLLLVLLPKVSLNFNCWLLRNCRHKWHSDILHNTCNSNLFEKKFLRQYEQLFFNVSEASRDDFLNSYWLFVRNCSDINGLISYHLKIKGAITLKHHQTGTSLHVPWRSLSISLSAFYLTKCKLYTSVRNLHVQLLHMFHEATSYTGNKFNWVKHYCAWIQIQ